jgi:tRNA(Ile)-lysidine synthase
MVGSKATESAARDARYEFLRHAAHQIGARYLATGHTADDQAETILHRILRGTGLRGIRGIPRARSLSEGITVIRPLLSVRRSEVLNYLESLGQDFREDVTNCDPRYTRNRIRTQLMPLLTDEFNHEIVDSLIRLGQIATDGQSVIDQIARCKLDQCIVADGSLFVELDCRRLSDVSPYLACELFMMIWRRHGWPQREMSYDRWLQLAELANNNTTTRHATLPGSIHVSRQDFRLTIRVPDPPVDETS